MISVIIPVLNEEVALPKLLAQIQSLMPDLSKALFQIIVVDGGSTDSTVSIASQLDSIILLQTVAGRAHQCSFGANHSAGSVLCFLHADTIISANFLTSLVSVYEQAIAGVHDNQQWGRFDIRMTNDAVKFRILSWFINTRSRWTGVATGDQGIFVSRDLFDEVGGFKDIEIMEDIDLCKRLKKRLRPVCLKTRITTSSRRWEYGGFVKTILLMWGLRLAFFIGVHPSALSKFYRGIR